MVKTFDIQILDVHNNKVMDGFEVKAEDWQQARYLAHNLDIIQEDMDTFNYVVFSVCERGTEDKHIFTQFIRGKDKEANLTILS